MNYENNIAIVNMNYKSKKNEVEYIIDRTSPLGNPYVLYNELERNNVCDKYAEWFYIQIEKGNEQVLDGLKLFSIDL